MKQHLHLQCNFHPTISIYFYLLAHDISISLSNNYTLNLQAPLICSIAQTHYMICTRHVQILDISFYSLLTDHVVAEKEEPGHWKRGWLLHALLESHKREMPQKMYKSSAFVNFVWFRQILNVRILVTIFLFRSRNFFCAFYVGQ
ncbi:hypothetical protein PIB30_117407 [Stylosanthes scabra]|uniref:Uncharacterized protein n=1 Tax=Stylosanthes scabra TaxID=79078 RepID=A0ABU6YGA1_9FABA|nr:hypothetical protein [Stylosanthes scabra]